MRNITILILLIASTATAQVKPYAGVSGGYMTNTQQLSYEIKAGAMIGNASIEASAALSQYVPFQYSIRAGYQFGQRAYITPQIGHIWQFYGNGKQSNTMIGYGAEIGYIVDMTGTYGEGVDLRITAGYFGRYGGVGIRVGF